MYGVLQRCEIVVTANLTGVDDRRFVAHAIAVVETHEDLLIARVERRLGSKFGHLSPDQISVAVADAWKRFERSSVRDFVPLLVERRAGAQLAEVK